MNKKDRETKYMVVQRQFSVFLLSLAATFSLLVLGLVGCGEAPGTENNAPERPANSQSSITQNSSPEMAAEAVVSSLKASSPAPNPSLPVASNSAGVPAALLQVVQSKGSSVGSLFATDQYGSLVRSSAWQRLPTPGLNSSEYVVLESSFEYKLTNGVARLGFSKKPGGNWQLACYNLDFDPPGIITRSSGEMGQDGLTGYQPKSFLEAVTSQTRERLDRGIEAVYGIDTGFIAVGNIRQHWRSSIKPFALSLVPSVEGRSNQWLVHFDGRNRQAESIVGTIRILNGQPWGLFVGSNSGSPQKPELGFTLGSMSTREDSTATCAKISYKPRCNSLEYNKTGWGIALNS